MTGKDRRVRRTRHRRERRSSQSVQLDPKAVRHWRVQRGFTQRSLAQGSVLLDGQTVQISYAQIRRIEIDGTCRPSTARILAALLDVEFRSLLPTANEPLLCGASRVASQVFVGRDATLDELTRLIASPGGRVMIALEGPPGLGKTEVALQLASRLECEGIFRVFWLDAETPDLTAAWGGPIASDLGIREGTLDARVRRVLDRISSCREPVLIVVDNVRQWSAAAPWPRPRGSHLRWLIITRVPQLGNRELRHIQLAALGKEAAQEVVAQISPRSAERPGFADLVACLNGHPLALQLAASFLERFPEWTPQQYLDALRSPEGGRLQQQAQETTLRGTLERAFELLWCRLPPDLRDQWALAACFANAPASSGLADAVGLSLEAREQLRELHLLAELRDGRWSMHRSTREFGRSAAAGLPTRVVDSFLEGCLARARSFELQNGFELYLPDRAHFELALRHAEHAWAERDRALAALREHIRRGRESIGDGDVAGLEASMRSGGINRAGSSPFAEQRQLTMMVIAIEARGSPRRGGTQEMDASLRLFHETAERLLASYEGRLGPPLGEKLIGYFGYPTAHEDGARRAAHAALAVVHELRPAVRIGIHSGLVIVVPDGSKHPVLEDDLHLAERLQEAAAPGTVLISSVTARLTQGRFVLSDPSEPERAALPQDLAAYRVERARVAATEPTLHRMRRTPLVGRENELGVLNESWEEARKGRGQIVLVSGEAGLGKSRLVEALREELDWAPKTWLQCSGSPYHQNSALHPIIELLKCFLAFDRDEDEAESLAKLRRALEEGGQNVERAVPLLARLLSQPMPPEPASTRAEAEQRRRETLDTLSSWVIGWTVRQPVVLVVEDLHWIDPSTLDLLELFVASAPTASLLLVLSARPSFAPAWLWRSSVIHLTLRPLSTRQVEQMIDHLVGSGVLPQHVRAEIVDRSDGVPLFVEDLTHMVLESALHGPAAATEPSVPATLRDSMMARLDRLGSAKNIAQLASILGREFSYELLRTISCMEEEPLREGLRRLVEAEHVYKRGEPPEAVYFFRHVLLQEAAYHSLVTATRTNAHGRALDALRASGRARPELLARHAEEAGRRAEAIEYWQRAGDAASSGAAYTEAVSHIQRALRVLKSVPETRECGEEELWRWAQRELELLLALGMPLGSATSWANPEVGQVYHRAVELGNQVGDAFQRFQGLRGVWQFYAGQGEYARAHELGDTLLELAKSANRDGLLLETHRLLGNTAFFSGDLTKAHAWLQAAVELAAGDAADRPMLSACGQDPEVANRGILAWTLCYLGQGDAALGQVERAVERARFLEHPFTLAFACGAHMWVHVFLRRPAEAREWARQTLDVSERGGFSYLQTAAHVVHGWARVALGEHAGAQEIEGALTLWRTSGETIGMPIFTVMLSESYLLAGRVDEAHAALAEALFPRRGAAEGWVEPLLHCVRAEILLAAGAPEACRALDEAATFARTRGARLMESRALAQLHRCVPTSQEA